WAAARSASNPCLSAVTGRLFASTRCIPAASPVLRISVVSAAVRSTRIGFERAWRATKPTASAAVARWPPAALASETPFAFAAPSAASRRGAKPRASNTKPLRSISATIRSFRESCFTFAMRGASARPICPNPNAIDLPARDLPLERRLEAAPGPLRAPLGHAEADRVLGRRLADEGDRNPLVMHGGEGAGRDAGDAEHPAAGHGQERLVRDGRERLDGILVERAAARDLGAERARVRERADADGDVPLDHRHERTGVQHLGAV